MGGVLLEVAHRDGHVLGDLHQPVGQSRHFFLGQNAALPRRTARQKAHTGRGICRPAGLLQGMRCPERRDLYAVHLINKKGQA